MNWNDFKNYFPLQEFLSIERKQILIVLNAENRFIEELILYLPPIQRNINMNAIAIAVGLDMHISKGERR